MITNTPKKITDFLSEKSTSFEIMNDGLYWAWKAPIGKDMYGNWVAIEGLKDIEKEEMYNVLYKNYLETKNAKEKNSVNTRG